MSTLALCASAHAEPPFFEYAKIDPHKVVTSEKCGECHIHEAEVWKRTPHAEGFKTLHRKEQAEAIAEKMGFRLIKRDSLCFSCHYTPIVESGKIRVVSGVSCESCHGAGADYLEIHNNYGPGNDRRSEPAAHRRERIAESRKAGMRRPSDLYPVAANCFNCHSVPLERLVNEGGHTTGSGGFELVEWSQERIRHNFLDSSLGGGDPVNVERPMSRKRVMYVVGRALDLEYSLRGMAKATSDGIYSKAMNRRVRSAVSELRAIGRAAEIPQVDQMLAGVKAARVVPDNESELVAAAESVGRATRGFLERADSQAGANLAALDDLVRGIEPPPDEESLALAEGQAQSQVGPQAGSESEAGAQPGAPAGSASGSPGVAPVRTGGESGASATSGASGGIGASGAFKTRIRPASRHKTIGPGNCAGCHPEQNQWWFGHAHSRSVDPFFDGNPKNLQIARLYGVSPTQMTTGRAVCMDCHGTILTGKESREVLDGVGCESCHGAAGDWLEPHKNEAGKELGRSRPGHLAALEVGKADLRDPRKRAETCAGCHHVTEPRLLSAGHPSGAGFDYAKGMNEVRHWRNRVADTEMASAFRTVVTSRGPVPEVRVASLPAGGPAPAVASAVGGASKPGGTSRRSSRTLADERRAEAFVLRPPSPRPAGRESVPDDLATVAVSDPAALGGGLELPPLPGLAEATIEELLTAVQGRLRFLYRLVDPTNAFPEGSQ